jgi:hypothetical protein
MAKDNIPADNEPSAIDRDNVLDVEQLALKMGITGDQAQELVDRLGTDCQLLEAAARELRGRDG